jgi:3-hydroxyisobutyrate dehydrogenase-like beta-hydroxyacid dehydrogenase
MSNQEPNRIGIIGLGLLGSALAERLIAHGFSVAGFDPVSDQREALRKAGGEPADSPAAIWRTHARVILSLPNSDVSARVLSEARPDLRSDALVIDTTTGDPDQLATLGSEMEAMGRGFMDATVGGSSRQVRECNVIVMVGGRREHFARCQDIFATFARQSFFVGPCGSGAWMKLVTNLALGLNRLVLAEALGFAETTGLDAELALTVLKSSSSYSQVMDIKGGKMLAREYSPDARISQHLKDVRLILATGERRNARLPLSALHRTLLEEVEARGLGDADNSAIMEAFRPPE